MIERSILERYGMPLVSLVLAVFLWLYVVGQKELEWPFSVPVTVVVSSTEVAGSAEPDHVSVLVKGPRRMLEKFSDEKVEVRLVLPETKPGTLTRSLLPNMVTGVPSGIQILRIEPAEVRLELLPLIQRSLRIKPSFSLKDTSFVIDGDVTVDPRTIDVRSTSARLDEIKELLTEPIDVSGPVGPKTAVVPIAAPEGVHVEPISVRISYTVSASGR